VRSLLVLTFLIFASGAAHADWLFWHSKKSADAKAAEAAAKAAKAAGPREQQKLEQRIMRPDMTMEYDVSNSTFHGSDKKAASKKASVKDYTGLQKFDSKAYSTDSFKGAKSSWLKDEKFATSKAETKGKYELPNLKKKTDLKTVPVTESRDATKTVAVNASREGNQRFSFHGRSQDRMDAVKGSPGEKELSAGGYSGDLKPMTIDDIRTLLNKSK
jgi:hypothetical protein